MHPEFAQGRTVADPGWPGHGRGSGSDTPGANEMAKKSTGVALAVAWPLAKKVATQISVIVANNPELQKRIEGLGKKFADVQRARTPEAKITRAMDSVREQAEIVLASESSASSGA